ncbi:MAG TPA: YncE family protein [Terriglobales bacterium]|jgi:DNA-binding beta-propeller fold protein YncE|nr:YncE family protein [Terriglobales bacterium]
MKLSRKNLCLAALLLLFELGCGNQYRPVANPIISPGGQPQTVHYAWVLNYNPSGAGTTTQIDVSGDTNTAVNTMGVGTIAEAFPPNSLALFVANNGADSVSEFIPTLSTAVTTINLLPGSHPVALGSAQNTAMFVVNSGSNSACPNTGSISAIKTSSLAVSSTNCVGHNPIALAQAPPSGYVYVINQGDSSVSVFNPAGPSIVGTITTANGLGPNPISVTASLDGNWIFVVTQGDTANPPALDIISSTGTTVAASVPLGVGPTFSLIDSNLNRLYVVNTGDNTVSVFDSSNVNVSNMPPMPLLGTASVGTMPIGLTPLANGSLFYVLNAGSNNVTVVSANSFSALTTVALPSGADPVFIASDPTSSKVYVADKGLSQTTIIQTLNNTITLNIPAPSQIPNCTVCALQQPVMIVTR